MILNSRNIKTYSVRNVSNNDLLTGIYPSSSIWGLADEIDDFHYPWEKVPPSSEVNFRSLHNSRYLCCCFNVIDNDVKVFVDKNHKREVVHGDRVEMFLVADADLNEYYCLEIDPTGRVFDYSASFYRKFNETWR